MNRETQIFIIASLKFVFLSYIMAYVRQMNNGKIKKGKESFGDYLQITYVVLDQRRKKGRGL